MDVIDVESSEVGYHSVSERAPGSVSVLQKLSDLIESVIYSWRQWFGPYAGCLLKSLVPGPSDGTSSGHVDKTHGAIRLSVPQVKAGVRSSSSACTSHHAPLTMICAEFSGLTRLYTPTCQFQGISLFVYRKRPHRLCCLRLYVLLVQNF